MRTEILLPKLGFSMEEGAIAAWHVADGATIVEGQALYSLESEKSVVEIESPASGVLKIIAPIGETFKVGTVLGEIS